MLLAEFPEIQKLTKEKKLQLASELLASIGATGPEVPVPDEVRTLLDRRWQAHLDSPNGDLTLDEFKLRVEQLISARR